MHLVESVQWDVFRRITTYYNVLRRTLTNYDTLRRTMTYYDVLRRTATYHYLLRRTTTYYDVRQCITSSCEALRRIQMFVIILERKRNVTERKRNAGGTQGGTHYVEC